MIDPAHVAIVNDALNNGSDVEHDVKMTFGELILFHVLMQNYAPDYVGDGFIPLMERNKQRIDTVKGV
jgi:hypothetical protein